MWAGVARGFIDAIRGVGVLVKRSAQGALISI